MANSAPDALIDSHCHLDLPAFSGDFEAVLSRAHDAKVSRFHIPGTTAERWEPLMRLAARDDIDVSLGLHPYFLSITTLDELNQSLRHLELMLQRRPRGVVAVGECGLDTVIDVDEQLQNDIFAAHVTLAKEYGFPLVIHARKAHHLIQQQLAAQSFEHGGVIHAFNGSFEVAKQYVDRNFILGVGGTITYPRANKTRRAIQAIGLKHIVLETDSPDMPMMGFQGQRNMPERLPIVAQVLSELLNVDAVEVAAVTSANYLRMFH